MVIKTLEEVRDYIQEEYWETGTISGYKNFSINWNWNNNLLECLLQVPGFKGPILDLGCAYGQVVAVCLKKGLDAYGIDISDYAIAKGINEYAPLKDRIRQGSIHDLSYYEDNSFSFLYSQQVFEHLPSQYCADLAKEALRVIKNDGILWVGLVLDLNSDHQPQGFNPDDPDKTHINLRPREWWDDIFLGAGWSIENKFDERFRKTTTSTGYSFFKEYGWHSICYRKKK